MSWVIRTFLRLTYMDPDEEWGILQLGQPPKLSVAELALLKLISARVKQQEHALQ